MGRRRIEEADTPTLPNSDPGTWSPPLETEFPKTLTQKPCTDPAADVTGMNIYWSEYFTSAELASPSRHAGRELRPQLAKPSFKPRHCGFVICASYTTTQSLRNLSPPPCLFWFTSICFGGHARVWGGVSFCIRIRVAVWLLVD